MLPTDSIHSPLQIQDQENEKGNGTYTVADTPFNEDLRSQASGNSDAVTP